MWSTSNLPLYKIINEYRLLASTVLVISNRSDPSKSWVLALVNQIKINNLQINFISLYDKYLRNYMYDRVTNVLIGHKMNLYLGLCSPQVRKKIL